MKPLKTMLEKDIEAAKATIALDIMRDYKLIAETLQRNWKWRPGCRNLCPFYTAKQDKHTG